MFRYCYVHKRIFGIKKPLLNFKKTSGVCKRCLPGEFLKIRLWKEAKKVVKQLEMENGETKKLSPR